MPLKALTALLNRSVISAPPYRFRKRMAFAVTSAAVAAVAMAVAAGPASAGPKDPASPSDDHYQVYIGDPVHSFGSGSSSDALTGDWGSLQLSEPAPITPAGRLRSPSLTGAAAGTGITYFTPSVSGVRVGVGFLGAPEEGAQEPKSGSQYTGLGPRVAQPRDGLGNWQVGGKVGYSGLEIGANIGDHNDPTCEPGASCKKNDFWDIGVALRIGSGAIGAGYTASQPRTPRADDVSRIDVFSLNAGYRVHSRLDIYGGVDWIDLHSTNDATEVPLDTRFMLGTNLRF
jgi:Gram-negative porin